MKVVWFRVKRSALDLATGLLFPFHSFDLLCKQDFSAGDIDQSSPLFAKRNLTPSLRAMRLHDKFMASYNSHIIPKRGGGAVKTLLKAHTPS